MSVRNVGDVRIWSMGWEPAGVSAAGPDSDEGLMRPQMLLAEATRQFCFLTWQGALPPALMSAILRWPRFSVAQLEPGVFGLCWCPASPALFWMLELVCQVQLWTSVNIHIFQ